MKSKFLILHLSLFALIATANAQKNLIDGYIINLGGDTIPGSIDFRNPVSNPDNIYFKAMNDSFATKFAPFDIQGFGVDGRNYLSAIVDSEFSNRDDNSLPTEAELDLRTDSVFLQILILGTKSLYNYVNPMGNANFYIPEGNGFRLLEYKKHLKKTGTRQFVYENNRYTGQLTLYMNDCPDVLKSIPTTEYIENPMIQLFKRYSNKCGTEQPVFYKEPDKIRSEFGLLAGATFTTLNIKNVSDRYNHLLYLDKNTSVDFTAAAFYELIFPNYNERWSINSELAYVSFSTTGEYEEVRSANLKTHYSTVLAYDYLTFRFMARYHYPIGKVRLFGSAGVFNGFLINDKGETTTSDTIYSQVYVDTHPAFYTRGSEQGFLLGLGVKTDKWKMETRYEIGNGMSAEYQVVVNTSRILLQTGFAF